MFVFLTYLITYAVFELCLVHIIHVGLLFAE